MKYIVIICLLSAVVCIIGCVKFDCIRVPNSVVQSFTNRPAFKKPLSKAEISYTEFVRLTNSGEVVESVVSDGYVYFLIEIPWSWPMADGDGHWDGVLIDGIYRAKLTEEPNKRRHGTR